MRKFLNLSITLLCFLPSLALADSGIPIGPTISQLLARVAFLEAQIQNVPLTCAAQIVPASVSIGQPFTIYLGTYGDESGWPPTSEYTITPDRKGKWSYSFPLSNRAGQTGKCVASVIVTG